jgi:tetraacyldisaccharide 4'-kinase
MKQALAELERWGADVIFGRARGFRAAMMRLAMRGLSGIYRLVVRTRLKLYRHGIIRQHHLGTKVVSIGNLTVGGTGKTPVVELFARTLRDRGRRVAVLSRGYKSRKLPATQEWLRRGNGRPVPADRMPKLVSAGDGPLLDSKYAGDEPFMLASNLDEVAVVVDKDRVKGGLFAVRELESDVLILDDGMQYLRLGHALDVVLVDSRSPFGTNALLPRGTLREPPRNLKRASYVFITKCDDTPNDGLIERIRHYNPVAEIVECAHGPRFVENLFTGERHELGFLKDKWVAAISGIAVPENFERLLERLGARVEIRRRFSDHYRFPRREIDRFMRRCVKRDMELIVTTEKDAVRFPKPAELDMPVLFLRIEVEILRGREVWERLIDRLCDTPGGGDPLLRLRDAVGR